MTEDRAQKRHIVYVGYALEDGRAPHQAMAALYLALQGHSVTYLAVASKTALPNWAVALQTLKYTAFPGPRWSAAIALTRQLRRILATGRVDCLYVQGAQQALLCVWVPWLYPHVPILYHTQDFKPLITQLYSRAERVLARCATQVICNELNRAKVMELVHGLRETPAVIRTALPAAWPVPGRDLARRAALLAHLPEDRRSDAVLLAAGGPYMTRRQSQQLIQALAHLDPRYAVVFTGMGPDNPQRAVCLSEAQAHGVADRVVLLDRLGYYELLALYAACEIGVLLYCDSDLANFYQGPGRVTEYLRAGVPFVTSDWPGLELLTLKYGIGEAARSDDPADIARAITVLTPPDEPARHARADRLRDLAQTVLAYDHDASAVLGPRFGVQSSADQTAHPLWRAIAQSAGLAQGAEPTHGESKTA